MSDLQLNNKKLISEYIHRISCFFKIISEVKNIDAIWALALKVVKKEAMTNQKESKKDQKGRK